MAAAAAFVAALALLALGSQAAQQRRHIVFTCPQSHSIAEQMSTVAQELLRRGYKVTLWGNTRFQGLWLTVLASAVLRPRPAALTTRRPREAFTNGRHKRSLRRAR